MSAGLRARRGAPSSLTLALLAWALPALAAASPPGSTLPRAELSPSGGEPGVPEARPFPAELAFPTAGYHRHDGFFLRMTFGVGWGASELDSSGLPEHVWLGPGFASSFDLGAAVAENLIVHVRLRDASVTWPALRVDGEEPADQTGVLASQAMVGVGVQYYFMPINLFVGLALGIAGTEAVVEQRETWDARYNGGTGFGLDVELGREWWVSENWALGVAARLSLARVPSPDPAGADAHFEAGFGSLLFSATYQ